MGINPPQKNIKDMLNRIIKIGFFFTLLFLLCNCSRRESRENSSQKANQTGPKEIVGGGCDGCELMYVGMPEQISSTHTSLGWEATQQKLILTGKILRLDGKTPAPNVLLYYWHTDEKGLYSATESSSETSTVHGKLRGWIKSDQNGNYTIRTSRPAAYPAQDIPQHIHLSIKEPDIQNEYYADLYFDDDPLYQIQKKKYGQQDRAGSELLSPKEDNQVQIATHDIILGQNIPNYPK